MRATQRLLLRNLMEKDAEDLFEYSKEEDVGKNAGWKPHESLEESKKILQVVFLGQEDVFGMFEKDSQKLIGTVGFVPDTTRENDEVKMLGFALGKAYWGKGYMTEAVNEVLSYGFGEKGYNLISVCHYTDNLRSQRVIEKCGFQFEGLQRQSEKRYDGAVMDKKWYSMTKEEFYRKMK
ncbi:GNAT family N-acetyltransferase [Anaerotignum sp. MB30-C6]|uniref:GNAT family N-acetyltransferase n=1 Tax=Anaerotignum sp. MB30-C6 TaxID=3070814 RepID=UPI0027DD44C3|nr:GNAT family protein [Anaerotignum sp. MB30-C6]WMI80638.1 GNAT family protein [Anaerotignum sp. MB30-C6]